MTIAAEYRSFIDVLTLRAEQKPDGLAFQFLPDSAAEPVPLTYAGLQRRAQSVAEYLQSSIPQARQALLLYPPGLDFVAGFWGCLYAGVAAVPVNPPRPNQSFGRLQAVIADAQAGVVLTVGNQLAALQRQAGQEPAMAGLHWIATDEIPEDRATAWQRPNVSGESLAFLQYTSGSTGSPKGVMITHSNLLANSEYLRRCFELTPESVSVCWLPSFHDMGLLDGVLQPTYTGFQGVLMPPVSFLQSPIRWLQAITRYRGTHCGGPNFGYDLCVKKISTEQMAELDLRSWSTAYNGAEPVSRETLERFASHFATCGFEQRFFYPCYGMAESTLIISGGNVADPPKYFAADAEALERHRVIAAPPDAARVKHVVGCGNTWMDTQVLIADPDSGEACGDDAVGEIWVRGASVTQGYWNRPDLHEVTFAALPGAPDIQWLRTGDLGFLRDGELYVTGRIKDVIIIRGQNYYPQDLEQSVQERCAGMRQSCGAAFTVEANGQERLVIVQEVERTLVRHLDTTALTKSVREAIAVEHGLQVHTIALIKPASIPKTSSGKIQRRACKQRFLEGTLDVLEMPARIRQTGTVPAETGT